MSPLRRTPRSAAVLPRAVAWLAAMALAVGVVTMIAAPPASANPGGVEWANRFGGNTTQDGASGVTGDAFGNTYVASEIQGQTAIGQKVFSTSTLDVVVVKLLPDGSVGWVRAIGGPGAEHAGKIAVDNSGNVYVTGSFGATMTVAGTTVSPVGVSDQFLVALDNGGNPKWIKTMGGATADGPPLLEVDSSGFVVVGSTFWGTTKVAGVTLTSVDLGDIWLARFNGGTGALAWAERDGGTANEHLDQIAFGSGNGTIVALGSHESGASTIGGVALPNTGTDGGFVASYDNAGKGTWVRALSATQALNNGGLAVDPNGQIAVTGGFVGTLTGAAYTLSSPVPGKSAGFLAELTRTGTPTAATTFPGSGDIALGPVKWDRAGNLATTIEYDGTYTFGGGVYTAAGFNDLLTVTVSPTGSPIWAEQQASTMPDAAADLAVVDGDTVIVGQLHAATALGKGIVLGTDGGDAFAIRFGNPDPALAINSYQPMTPVRILDSRNGTGVAQVPWGPTQTRALAVGGQHGVPADATAVVMNVTVTDASADTHVTVFPSSPQPATSNLNVVAGQTAANLVTVKVGAGGLVSFYNAAGSADIVADVVGYYRYDNAASFEHGVVPVRQLDSRDGTGGYNTKWGPAVARSVTVAGVGQVPPDATAVVMDLTAIAPSADTHLTVWPAGQPQPTASSLNLAVGQIRSNLVMARVGANGKITIFNNSGSVDVVGDVVAYFRPGTGGAFLPVTPARIADSRIALGPESTPWGPGANRQLQVTGRGGVPDGATAVVLNVTATNTTADTHLTVYPQGTPKPATSNLNVVAGRTVPNQVLVQLGGNGYISIFNNAGNADVIVDVVGWFS